MSRYTAHTETAQQMSLIDIATVVTVSLLGYVFEGIAIDQGWFPLGADARGVTGVMLGALAAIAVVFARGGSFVDLGFKRPASWGKAFAQALAVLIAFIAAQNLIPALLSTFMTLPEPDFSRHAHVAGNLGAAIFMALVLPITASIPEEIIYRGFLIGRLTHLFGEHTTGAVLTVVVQALIFGSIHFEWGFGGMIMTFTMGLVWGTAYLLCNRNLWVVIMAHSGGHLLFVTQLYYAESMLF